MSGSPIKSKKSDKLRDEPEGQRLGEFFVYRAEVNTDLPDKTEKSLQLRLPKQQMRILKQSLNQVNNTFMVFLTDNC